MKYLISVFPWQEEREASSDLVLKKGDTVVADLGFGKHLALVKDINKEAVRWDGGKEKSEEVQITRKAAGLEKEKVSLDNSKRDETMKKCRNLIQKYNLPMKLVGMDISIDGGGIVFGFTAEERIDFRQLVRDLASIFQKSVRLQQLGSRDEARMTGGLGPCGRRFCCLSSISAMQSISTEMARLQQISHRGNERLSGCCNRLMCCLAFEQKTYELMRENLPDIGEEIETPSGKGRVENLKILSQSVGVRLEKDPEKIIWVKSDKITRKK